MDNSWITRKAINETMHFKDQARLRRIDPRLVRDGIGLDILLAEEEAGLRCDRSDKTGRGLATPEVGKPVHIGRYFGEKGKNREVLLVKLRNGRRLHLVAAFGSKRVDLITGWYPDDPDNLAKWHPHGLRPTRTGEAELPWTRWFLDGSIPSTSALAGRR